MNVVNAMLNGLAKLELPFLVNGALDRLGHGVCIVIKSY